MGVRVWLWLLVVLVASSALAQPAADRVHPSRLNAARLRWFQYKLVAGRVVVTSSYPEGMNISFGPSTTDTQQREKLQLLILEDRASIRYELSGGGEELAITLTEAGEFSIRRTREHPLLNVEFVQPPDKPLTLLVQSEQGETRRLTGPSLWHLYLAEPELFARELVPHLEILRPAWQLVSQGEQLERTLIQRAQHPASHDTHHWQTLVKQLGSANFSERESAERELAGAGQAVLPFLEGLAPAKLDAEQAARVTALIEGLRVDYEDTPARVAGWLVADVDAWLLLANREEPAKRRVATERLTAIAGETIDFDPDADAQTRGRQLEQLHRRLGSRTNEAAASGPAEDVSAPGSVPPPGIER